MGRRPSGWLDRRLYPFADHWVEERGCRIHYVDEGAGTPVLMLHGNPTWSFLYRDVIRRLTAENAPTPVRAVAPDYPGFGLSQASGSYRYTPEEHASVVESLLDHLELSRFVLVAHDWGGPIGLGVALRRPRRVSGIVLCNTWCWKPDLRLRAFSTLVGGPVGRYLVRKHDLMARWLLPALLERHEADRAAVLEAYAAPFATEESRRGTWVLPRAIRTSVGWLEGVRDRLSCLEPVPVEMVWGMKDPAFGREVYIERWRELFPNAKLDRLPDAGHYVPEDRPERVSAAVERILADPGVPARG